MLNSRLETVFVFGCSWSAERESLISVSEVAAFPAVFIHNCLCTRDTDRDLLLIGADGQLSLINSNGWQLALPWSVPDPASVKVVDSLVIYPSPSSPSITTIHNLRQIPAPSDSLTGRCWRGLSQVLTDDEFMKLYKTDFEQGITDDHWTRFRRLFTHDDQPEQSSEDLFQRLLVSKAPGRSSVGPSRRLSNLVNLPMVARAIPRLHGILQDYLCQKTNAVVTPLGFLLADLARLLRWRNWYDYYLRQGFRVDPPPNEMPMVEEPPYPEDTIALLANLLQSGIDPTRHSDQEIAQTDLDHDSRDAARLVQSFMSLCQSGSQASPASSLADKAIAVSKTLSGAHDAMPPVELSKYAAFSVLPVRESIRLVLSKPPVDQPASFYDFIGRRDLARQMGQSDEHVHQPVSSA